MPERWRVTSATTRRLLTHWHVVPVVASLFVNFVLFEFLAQFVGGAAGALVVLPIAIAAWWYGKRGRIAVSVVATLMNGLLLAGAAGVPPILAAVQAIFAGVIFGVVGLFVGYSQSARRRIAQLTLTDAATGLPNRDALMIELDRREQRGANITLAVLELDELTLIGDTFGVPAADEVLRLVGVRARAAFGDRDMVARNRSKRFSVLVERADVTDETIAERLLEILERPFIVGGAEIHLTGRAAVGRRETVGTGGVGLVRAVAAAVDRAGRVDRRWAAAERPTAKEGDDRLQVLVSLRTAINEGQLRLHYQPIVELPARSIRGFEALVRWQHPERGLVPPSEFIPLAEQSGLIVKLTEWVLTEAIRQSRIWSASGLRLGISVNVGAKALTTLSRLPELTRRLLREYEVDPASIVLEVTESDMMADPVRSIDVLRELKAIGVLVEIDDFGTGYSSLSYLQQLPVDGVKIDRSFITPLRDDTTTAAIVRAAIDLSHALGLDAIAEGVEDERVLTLLTSMGCDTAQGYFIARPMAANDVPPWVAAHQTAPAGAEPVAHVLAGSVTGTAGGTILVVDDEHPFRLAAHRILSAQGYRVIHAATASEAIRLSTSHGDQIDLLLTDLFLSDLRGNDLADRIRDVHPKMRVLIMSGDPKAAERAGAGVFLAKPFSRQQLISGVAEALAG